MNENSMNATRPADEEILEGIRTRLAGVEQFVSTPPAWRSAGTKLGLTEPDRMTARVQPRGAFGFGAALAILVVAVMAAASLGVLGSRNPAASGASPSALVPVTTVVYQLVTPAGVEPTAAELETTVQILTSRANSTQATNVRVTAEPPNRVSVTVSGTVDMSTLRSLLGQTGRLEIVLLPPDVYGTAVARGVKAVPATGDTIDPALPAQFTSADMDPDQFGVAPDPSAPDRSVIDFGFKPAVATEFADWTGQHVNDYIALVLDGVVQSVPYVFSRVDGGMGQISGNYTAADAETLVALLRYGALPFPVQEVSIGTSTPMPQASVPLSSSPLVFGQTPTGGPVTVIDYQLVPPDGSAPTRAELEQTVLMLAYRMTTFFPTDSQPSASGQVLPDLSAVQGFSVTGVLPDQVIVRYEADVKTDSAGRSAWMSRRSGPGCPGPAASP